MAVNGQTIIDETTLTALGNAIRAKTGGTALMTPAEMVEAINDYKGAFPWSWGTAISNIVIAADYSSAYTQYGSSLQYIALGASCITFINLTVHDDVIGWLDYLPDGGNAQLRVLASVGITDEEAAAVTAKGYSFIWSY